MNKSVLSYGGSKAFKYAACLSLICLVLYLSDDPPFVSNGGTFLGYGLGSVGAILIVWLMWFGIRKRSYKSSLGTVSGWLSGHIWLGISLLLVGTLHTGFQFGWNIHTLAYFLMLIVIFSGIWGVYVYARNPALMRHLLEGKELSKHAEAIHDMDAQMESLVKKVSKENFSSVKILVDAAFEEPLTVGLFGKSKFKGLVGATAKASLQLELMASKSSDSAVRELFLVMAKREREISRIREFLRLKRMTDSWLILHVPLSFGLLASLIAHIFSVFYYW